MSPETLFSIGGKLAMAGWAVLIFLPRWRWTQRIAAAIIPLTLAALPRNRDKECRDSG